MNKFISLLLIGLLLACNTTTKKETQNTDDPNPGAIAQKERLAFADYSTLLIDYECTISISELAKAIDVPDTALSLSKYPEEGKCNFIIKGFGKNTLGGESEISWGSYPTSKAQNKKEIASYLERKEDGLKIMGMDIQLAETNDCYIAYQPAHGRIIIYNEHYDHAFLLTYGQRNANTNRTKEQHEALRFKMTTLANYLLKKHRK